MRILKPFSKKGKFWLPNNKNEYYLGTLIVLSDGDIKLDLDGTFHEDHKITDIGMIYGLTTDNKKVTLDQCFYLKKKVGFVFSEAQICVSFLIENAHLNDIQKVKVEQFDLKVDKLPNWLLLSGFKMLKDKVDSAPSTFEWNRPEEYTVEVENFFTLSIEFGWYQGGPNINCYGETEIIIKESPYLQIIPKQEISFDKMLDYSYKITNFLSFASDDILSITKLSFFVNKIIDEDQNTSELILRYYGCSHTHTQKISNKYINNMLFCFPRIKGNFNIILKKWFENYEIIDPALDLYFAVQFGAYKNNDARFLALAQALETLHRRHYKGTRFDKELYTRIKEEILESCPPQHHLFLSEKLNFGNELTLHNRLDELISPFLNLTYNDKNVTNPIFDDIKKLIKDIKNTRNYLTHYDTRLEKKSIKGEKLYYLTQILIGLMQLQLLNIIGFQLDEIQNICNNSKDLQNKLINPYKKL